MIKINEIIVNNNIMQSSIKIKLFITMVTVVSSTMIDRVAYNNIIIIVVNNYHHGNENIKFALREAKQRNCQQLSFFLLSFSRAQLVGGVKWFIGLRAPHLNF